MGIKVDISGGGIGVIQPGAKHGLILIGKAVQSKEDTTDIGYLLYDAISETVDISTYEEIKGLINPQQVKLLGMLGYGVDFLNFKNDGYDGKLTAIWGDEDKLPVVTADKKVVKRGTYIISSVQDDAGDTVGFVTINPLGARQVISKDDLINFMHNYSAVNCIDVQGKILRTDGKEFPVQKLQKADMDIRVLGSLEGRDTTDTHNRCDVDGVHNNKNENEDIAIEGYNSAGEKIDNFPFRPVFNIQTLTDSERTLNESAGFKMIEIEENLAKVAPYYCSLFRAINAYPYPEEKDKEEKTWGVSEKALYYGTNFTLNNSLAVLTFVAIHEVLHMALQHHSRKGKRNHKIFNIATDMMINAMICDEFGLSEDGKEVTYGNGGVIAAPEHGVFPSRFNKVLDFRLDTEESIYAEIYREMEDKMQNGDGEGEGDGTSGSGGKMRVTYNGVTAEVDCDDLCTEIDDVENQNEQSTQEKRNQMSKEQLSRMQAQVEYDKREGNAGFGDDAGSAGANIMRNIEYGLSAGVNWKRALQNAIKHKPQKMYTLASPHKFFMGQGMTVATQRRIGKPATVTGVKICIDVSGSVSEEILNKYLAEVTMLFKRHKVTGELIYWSTEIGGAGEVETLKDMLKVPPHSTGGTDVKCVFEYLTREKPFDEKLQPMPLKDIPLIIIITDGYFDNNYEQYAKKVGRKVLWIIDGNPAKFTPPFGKVIGIDDNYR